MPRSDNRYSQFVSATKIILPLLALGMLSSLFLLSGARNDEQTIPISDLDLADIVEGQRILMPRYRSVLESGATLELTAETARPDPANPDNFTAQEITGTLTELSGERVDLRGASGFIDGARELIRISGGLRLARTDGVVLTSERGEVSFDGSLARTDTQVVIVGPEVTLSAGRGTMTTEPGTGRQQLLFTDGVKLIYTPQK